MFDRFERKINYLRISVTDRCNLRCVYCMPEKGLPLVSHDDILSYEEITEVAKYAASLGFDKARVTGGEPLVRKGIVDLVSMLSKIKEIKDLCMSTNGHLLDEFAAPLKKAGLRRVNVSLDAMNPERYAEITRGGDVARVLVGIRAADKAGLFPIKLNCVVKENSREPDARDVARFANDRGYRVQFIRKMEISNGKFWGVEGGNGGDCGRCNRLRLMSNGEIKPCLFSDLGFNVRELGVEEAFRLAIMEKPESGLRSEKHEFYHIGG